MKFSKYVHGIFLIKIPALKYMTKLFRYTYDAKMWGKKRDLKINLKINI